MKESERRHRARSDSAGLLWDAQTPHFFRERDERMVFWLRSLKNRRFLLLPEPQRVFLLLPQAGKFWSLKVSGSRTLVDLLLRVPR